VISSARTGDRNRYHLNDAKMVLDIEGRDLVDIGARRCAELLFDAEGAAAGAGVDWCDALE
jgi:hypothetical protein